MTKINLEQLRKEIRNFPNRSELYYTIKHELTALGFWRNRPRGNPSKGYQKMKESKGDH